MAARGGLIVLGTAVLIAAAVPALPYLTGLHAETRFERWVDGLRRNPAVEVHAVGYQRDWGNARARTDLTLHLPHGRLRLAVDHRIEHGPRPDLPALARITSIPEVPEPLRSLAGRLFVDRPPVKAVTTLRLDGSQRITVRSPPFDATLQADEPTRVRWQGMRLGLRFDDHRFGFDGRAPGLIVAAGRNRLRLQGLTLSGRLGDHEGMWLGDHRLRVERFAVAGPAGFALDGLRLRLGSAQTGPGLLRLTNALEIDALSPAAGPAYRRLGYRLVLERIDRGAYQGLGRLAARLRHPGAGVAPGPAGRQLAGLVRRLLARSPRVALERLTAFGPHGTAEASAALTFHGGPGLDPLVGTALLQRIEFKGRARLPKGMLETLVAAGLRREAERQETDRYALPPADRAARIEAATQRRLRTFQQAGFIEEADGDYVTRARLTEGRLTVNGRPLPIGAGAGPAPER